MEINCSLKPLDRIVHFRVTKGLTSIWKHNEITIQEQQNVLLSKLLNSFIHQNMYETDYTALELQQHSLQNYNQLRIVDKIFIFEWNHFFFFFFFFVSYRHISRLIYCMQKLFLFYCMYLLWPLTLMHYLLKGSAVHLYQYMVYAYYAFPWRFHASCK